MSEQIELAPSIKEIFAALLGGDLEPGEAEALVQDHIEAERISLRDEFAMRSDQPGRTEIAAAAGLTYRNNNVWLDAHTGELFDDWWSDLTPARRMELYATVRYQMADSMLEARKK